MTESQTKTGEMCACGKRSMHYDGGKKKCCECHVRSGAPPSDWHPACMATYEAMANKSETENTFRVMEVDPKHQIDFSTLKRDKLLDQIRRVIANPENLERVVDAINKDWFPLLGIDEKGKPHIYLGEQV